MAIHPTQPGTLFVGGAQAGVWKSTNGGQSWIPLTDDQCSLAMGSIALDPVDPQIIYAGTGEQHFSGDSYYGCGVLRSTDGGASWERLDAVSFLRPNGWGGAKMSRVVVDPVTAGSTSGTRVYAATDLGFFVSDDSGQTWSSTRVGIVTDLVVDPDNPQRLYIALHSEGVERSTDGGGVWESLDIGASLELMGRVNLAISRSSPRTLYAAAANRQTSELLGIFRTDDWGGQWRALTASGASCGRQCWYDLALAVAPDDPERVYFGGVGPFRSLDGGESFHSIRHGIHVDQHYILPDPDEPLRVWVTNDGGIYRTDNGGETWTSLNTNLSMTQFYAGIPLHPTDASVVMGGTQDNGTVLYKGTPAWSLLFGGDGGYTAINPVEPNVRYGETQWSSGGGGPRRSTGGGFVVSRNGIDTDESAAFIPPLVMDPYEPTVLYFGTERVYRTSDGGDLWEPISPVLNPGGYATTLAPARPNGRVLYAGTNLGSVHVTEDGGETWRDASAGLPNRVITDFAVHPHDARVAYVTVSGFGSGHVFLTDDGGQTWSDVSGFLPDMPVNAVLIDPGDPSFVYLGTDLGVYAGVPPLGWQPLGDGFPMVAVFDLAVEPGAGHLVAATHGRGMFSLPLQAPLEVTVRPPPQGDTVYLAEPTRSGEARVGVYGTGWSQAVWTASGASSAWLEIGTATGMGRSTLTWSVDASQLPVGLHRDSIVVAVDGAAEPARVAIGFLLEPSDTLQVVGSPELVEVPEGWNDPVADSITVVVRGPTADGKVWAAEHGSSTWLTLSSDDGTDGDVLRWNAPARPARRRHVRGHDHGPVGSHRRKPRRGGGHAACLSAVGGRSGPDCRPRALAGWAR